MKRRAPSGARTPRVNNDSPESERGGRGREREVIHNRGPQPRASQPWSRACPIADGASPILLLVSEDEPGRRHYEETPRWQLLMYPIDGAVGVLAMFAAWITFRYPLRNRSAPAWALAINRLRPLPISALLLK